MKTWNQQLQNNNFNGNGATKPSTEEFWANGTELRWNVSFKPPLAYKSTQFGRQMKIELPELLLSSVSTTSIKHRRRGLNFDSTWTPSTRTSRNPLISSNTPLRFILENELEGPSAKWSQLRALVEWCEPLAIVRLNRSNNPRYLRCRAP